MANITAKAKKLTRRAHDEIARRTGREYVSCEKCEHLAYCQSVVDSDDLLVCELSDESALVDAETLTTSREWFESYTWPVFGMLRLNK